MSNSALATGARTLYFSIQHVTRNPTRYPLFAMPATVDPSTIVVTIDWGRLTRRDSVDAYVAAQIASSITNESVRAAADLWERAYRAPSVEPQRWATLLGGTAMGLLGFSVAAIKGSPIFWIPVVAILGRTIYSYWSQSRQAHEAGLGREAALESALTGVGADLLVVIPNASHFGGADLAALLRLCSRLASLASVRVALDSERESLEESLALYLGKSGASSFSDAHLGTSSGSLEQRAMAESKPIVESVRRLAAGDEYARVLEAASSASQQIRACDRLALEGLRAIEPRVYAQLADEMALLTGISTDSTSLDRAERTIRLERLLGNASVARREEAAEILRQMFPASTWTNGWSADHNPDRWLEERRICHPALFEKVLRS